MIIKVNQCSKCGAEEDDLSIVYGTMYKDNKFGCSVTCDCCGNEIETDYIYSSPEDAVQEAVKIWNKGNKWVMSE